MSKRTLSLSLSLMCLGVLPLCGCSRHYVLRLNNGMVITTASKPKLKNGYYYYKDALGQENATSAMRVREIEPASMAHEEDSRFRPPPSK